MIQLDRLSMTYKSGVIGIKPISLSFIKGQFTVILGASGSGKSTLLRCLNYLNRPTTGTVIVEGLGNLHNRKVLYEHRKRTGMIFQQHQLISRQTALGNVLVGRLAYHSTLRSFFPLPKADQYIALECLDRVGLLHKALTRVDTLSGGQQQRVGIARALAQKPQLILADEPVASLDPASAHKVLSFLRQTCQEDGISAILSLHQIDLARIYADRIIGLSQGMVVLDGKPADISAYELKQLYSDKDSPDDEGFQESINS
jgi:phosphonate transport system ATP-binding protein